MLPPIKNAESSVQCCRSALVSLRIRIMRIRIWILGILCRKKLNFYMKNILRRYKSFLKVRKSGLFGNFGRFPCSWIQIRIRIRIPNTDPDPGQKLNQCGSVRIRIHKTGHVSTRPRCRTRIFFITRIDFATFTSS